MPDVAKQWRHCCLLHVLVWSVDIDAVLVSMSCFLLLCEEAVHTVWDKDLTVIYASELSCLSELSAASTILTTVVYLTCLAVLDHYQWMLVKQACLPRAKIYSIVLSLNLLVNYFVCWFCHNEKFGTQIQKHVKELVAHEMSPTLYPILFDQIKAIVEKFFDLLSQSCCHRTKYSIYRAYYIHLKSVLENKVDHTAEHLGVSSIEGMMLAIVRYVRHLILLCMLFK
ncbi:neurofibromin [Caerostris extrusa]|uniref:Neurofibromin n=1 Tax=Caerostris extrusa TaxID=172846 RepID=A0AAV4Y7R4_CAEEX|nr:neurofibromin [Caerostris extrusa]